MSAHHDNPISRQARDELWTGLFELLVGIVFLVVFCALDARGIHGWAGVVAPLLAVAVASYGYHDVRRARSRLHGLAMERQVAKQARQALERRGFRVRHGLVVSGLGDIDLVLERAKVKTPVEIKSFHTWDRRADRCVRALAQANRERAYLHADRGFVWLPDARGTWWQRWFGAGTDTIRVVFGSAHRLARTVHRALP